MEDTPQKTSTLKYIFFAISVLGLAAYIGTKQTETLTHGDGTPYTTQELEALEQYTDDPYADFDTPPTADDIAAQAAAQSRFEARQRKESEKTETLRAKWESAHADYSRISAYQMKTIGGMMTERAAFLKRYNAIMQTQREDGVDAHLSAADSVFTHDVFPERYAALNHYIENDVVHLSPQDSLTLQRADKQLRAINPSDPYTPFFKPE